MEGDLPHGASSFYRKYTRVRSIEVTHVCLTARSNQSSLSIVDDVSRYVSSYKFARHFKRFCVGSNP